MTRKFITLLLVGIVVTLTVACIGRTDAFARAGGGRSIGSTGSRSYSPSGGSYSRPAPSPYQSSPSPYQSSPNAQPAPSPQPAGGGFFRSMAGGLLGGMLGGMLFRSLGFGGYGFGGSGIGLFEIILIAGIGYMLFRMVTRRQREAVSYDQESYHQTYQAPGVYGGTSSNYQAGDVATGLAHIRQMDASFDEGRFGDQVMDIFFRIQGAWMNRDLTSAAGLLTGEMQGILQGDVDNLVREKRVNHLENIAVRNVEIVEAWQEAGQDYVTALIYANLLDYTTDDTTGQVVAGSRTEPVKFEEYWTFTRPVGNNPWRLTAINQK